jgi:hypothetical protein
MRTFSLMPSFKTGGYGAMIEDESGKWVRASDVEALLCADDLPVAPTCVWHLDDADDSQMWETSCGHAFQFNEDGPKENHAAFCCYCGKTLTESRTTGFSWDARPL